MPRNRDVPAVPPASPRIEHGGNLRAAAERFAIPLERWIDLSTGINPLGFPVPPVPDDVWRRLPEDQDGLAEVAARFFRVDTALPVAGSQAAIRAIPMLLEPGTVGIADLTYGEYAPAFVRAGHTVRRFAYRGMAGTHGISAEDAVAEGTSTENTPSFVLAEQAPLPDDLRYLVIVNPNNPTTDRFSAATLMTWRDTLAARDGMLIVDEAFIDSLDTTAHDSVASFCGVPGLIVLRSIGKFFGLAGVRAGFVLGEARFLTDLSEHIGAWTLSGPARHAVRHALEDVAWQTETRARLRHDSALLHTSLQTYGLHVRSTPLFAWFPHPHAADIQAHLARAAIWTRRFAMPSMSAGGVPSLRIGLPANAVERDRLDHALRTGEALLRLQ